MTGGGELDWGGGEVRWESAGGKPPRPHNKVSGGMSCAIFDSLGVYFVKYGLGSLLMCTQPIKIPLGLRRVRYFHCVYI